MAEIMQELKMAEDVAKVLERMDSELNRRPRQVPGNYYQLRLEELMNTLKASVAYRTGGLYYADFKTKR